MIFDFDNSYAKLPPQMFTALPPTPVAAPEIMAVNVDLAAELGLSADALTSPAARDVFAGNKVPDGAAPLAQLYAGHQFGNWNPQLGDGRAILLGEVIDTHGQRRDIHLKGAGRTPYSRGGDGRAWIGPVLREYLVSEAMHALGVPTTRALAAVRTGEDVYRETRLPGAVLTRVAASHIRVGTFQIFAARGDLMALKALMEHSIDRHYPEADGPQALLDAVVARQARLIAQWMGLGFIHGVMNTDNCAISGETIDYGPCAFMDGYHPGQVFSSIDRMGRYAYGNQPSIAAWNLAQLATALLPLMPDQDTAIAAFTISVNRFADLYQEEWIKVFGAKLGLEGPSPADVPLIEELLDMMAPEQADFTQTFTALTSGKTDGLFTNTAGFADWHHRWQARQANNAAEMMAQANPRVIPRNHQVEAMIAAAVAGDMAPFEALLSAVTHPTVANPAYEAAPAADEVVTATFCGT